MGKQKKNNNGKCALCDKENVELLQSHIIPKFTYSREKSHKKSRFRNFYNIRMIYQDGEKKRLLCSECEKFFNKYETTFANNVLDNYLKGESKLPTNTGEINEFIITVIWRILYDDIYIAGKNYESSCDIKGFIEYEGILKDYLNAMRRGEQVDLNKQIKSYIYELKDMGLSQQSVDVLRGKIFGYMINTYDFSHYVVFASFNGVVIATVYKPKVIVIGKSIKQMIKEKFLRRYIKEIIKKECCFQLEKMQQQEPVNKEILENGLQQKINDYYK